MLPKSTSSIGVSCWPTDEALRSVVWLLPPSTAAAPKAPLASGGSDQASMRL